MDYPIAVPGVGLSAGKFTNGNPLASLAASLDPAEWANAVTDEILNVITQGGLTPTENTNTQLATAIRNMIKGGDYKDSVRFTTTANIVLTGLGIQAGGDWPAVLTAGERILVKNQTAGAENGIYIAAAGAWPRATDADTGAELNSGAIIPVESGTLNADTNWQLTTDGAIVIGTTALTFGNVTGITQAQADARYIGAGYMLLKDEKAINVDAGSSVVGVVTRTLNTVSANTIAGASLSANQVTLPAGTYRVQGHVPAFISNLMRGFLYNVTDAVYTILGSSENIADSSAAQAAGGTSFIKGRFTIASAKVYEVRQFNGIAVLTLGLGSAVNSIGNELYTILEIIKES